MKKTFNQVLSAALFCASSLLSTQALATTELPVDQHTFQMGSTINYNLPSKEPQVFSNVFKWDILAKCTIIQTKEPRDISFKVLRKKAAINEVELKRGDSVTATVHPEEYFQLNVTAGATVQLTNESDCPVTTRCQAVTE